MAERKSNTKGKRTTTKGKSGCLIILLNIVLIAIVGLLLLWGIMAFLKSYTRHGHAIKTPDIVGLTQEQAQEMLQREQLHLEVVDSIYVEGKKPGIILDTAPKAGSRIKPNRTIFITVNTMNIKSIMLPEFAEQSERSVLMMLRGVGFKDISTEYVPGEHHLLVLRLRDNRGRYLQTGDRIPYNTPLIMEVASSELYETALMDSLMQSGIEAEEVTTLPSTPPATAPDETGENWF